MDWRRIDAVPGVVLEMPADLNKASEQPIDAPFVAWEGPGITVRIDQGPFSDPLTRYGDRRDHEVRREDIGGRPARMVSYREHDDSLVVGARFEAMPGGAHGQSAPLTVSVTCGPQLDPSVAWRIVRSVRFEGGGGQHG